MEPNISQDGFDRKLDDTLLKVVNTKSERTKQEREAAFERLDPTPEDRVVEELNEKHAVIHIDQFYILTEKLNPVFGGKDFTLESKQSFLNTYENQKVLCSDGKTLKSKAKIWLSHEKRRHFNGIVFDPTTKDHPNGFYNIWKGFALEQKKGSCGLFKKHIKEVICGDKEEIFKYVWKWTAQLVQFPQKLSSGLLLMGEQGTGKNTFSDALGKIFGPHYMPLDNIDQFLGHFNFHLKNAVLIHGNESVWGGDKRQLGKLKASITDEFTVIEGKGKDQLPMRNFKHLILSSNEDWPVHLDRDDRRFLTLKVSNKYKGDRAYFKDLFEELNNGGHEAFLYELLQENLSEFDVWEIPQNNEAFEVKMRSAPSTEKYIYEVLKEGSFDIGSAAQSCVWLDSEKEYFLTTTAIFIDYSNWCKFQGKKYEDESILGKALARLTLSKKNRRRDKGKRHWFYDFPTLKESRSKFQKEYKVGEAIWD
jgi:hypothetical protein